MVKRTGPQNLELQGLIRDLRKLGTKEKVNLWKRVAKDLERPTRIRRKVNLYTIEKVLRKDEIAIVPGKVLSLGEFSKKNTVAGFQFSDMEDRLCVFPRCPWNLWPFPLGTRWRGLYRNGPNHCG